MKKDQLKKMLMMSEDDSPMKGDSEKGMMAKADVLKELIEMMSKKAGDDVETGLRSVKVAAPSKEGLEKGLDLASDLVKDPEMMEDMEQEADEADQESEEEMMAEEGAEEEADMDDEMYDEEMKKKHMKMMGKY